MTDNHISASSARPSLAAFERLVANGEFPRAFRACLNILHAIDEGYGRLNGLDPSDFAQAREEERVQTFCNRFAASFVRLLCDPAFPFEAADYEWLILYHRWSDLILSLSEFGGSDRLLAQLPHTKVGGQIKFEGANMFRLLVLLSPNSAFPIDFDMFWQANPPAVAVAFLNYLSSRYAFSPRAFDFRERLLEWLPKRLDEVKLSARMLLRGPEFYMHCSYAATPHKHEIKRHFMKQMRRACLGIGCVETTNPAPGPDGRSTIVIVAEHLLPKHSVFRTHSRAVQALRDDYHLVGVVHPNPSGTAIASLFDECITIPEGDFLPAVRSLSAAIAARKPALVFHLGVGMVPHAVAIASLRLAPVQCVSFGHTASTMSPTMDYMILPEDFVGSRECFSERVLAVPAAAMPFAPLLFEKPVPAARAGIVRVAIAASIMKLNPRVFDAVARIAKRASRKVEFHFFPLAGVGLAHVRLARIVREIVPNAKVFPESPHGVYMERLAACDFFLSPFPYGNMNSVIDAFRLRLPGICLDGDEAHAHADAGLFLRIGLPPELIARTIDDYVAAAVRLIDDEAWREQCRNRVATADLDAAFFSGDARLFAQAIGRLIGESRR